MEPDLEKGENKGFIVLHRKILDNPLFGKPTWLAVWITLLLLASHKESTFIWNGEKKTLKVGQLLTGIHALAKKTGVHRSSVERALNYLETEKQIEQHTTTKYRVITILKWNYYQHPSKQPRNSRVTGEKQASSFNNDNNDNNDNKEREGDVAPQPLSQVDKIKSFFGNGEDTTPFQEEIIVAMVAKGVPEGLARQEMKKFVAYWTELTKSGKRQRWELEKAFEIKRRLATWFSRMKGDFNSKKDNKEKRYVL